MSDQVHEATNYIKDLKKKIQELSHRRDQSLKRLSNSSSPASFELEDMPNYTQDAVTVRFSWAGVEVVINTDSRQGFPLSKVLQVLIREGLSVVSYTSTKINGRLLQCVESEVQTVQSSCYQSP